MARRTLSAAITVALTLLAPAVAEAGSHFTWTPERLTVTTDGAGDVVSLYTRSYVDNGTTVVFPAFTVGDTTPTWEPTDNCLEDNGYVVCDAADSFLFQGAGGVDTFSITNEPELNAVPATLNGDAGNDKLQDYSPVARTLDGGEGNDVMFGSAGNDTMRGGGGNDEVDGEDGNDNVSGGGGDDILFGDHFKAPGADVIDGGPGFDKVRDWDSGESTRVPVNVTLDRSANDGRPGEGDNVFDVEHIEGPGGTYVGSDAAETFVVGEVSVPSSVSGGGGNDTITTQNGPDTIDGGAGDDLLTAGFDHDTVTGGPGRDAIYADSTASYCGIFTCTVPFGNDTVNARDGEPDQIDCSVGTDRAVTDTIDTVANCETSVAPPAGGLTILTARSIRQILRNGLKIRVGCPAACTIRARLVVNRRLARQLRLPRSRRLAAASKSLASAGTATLTLKVARRARPRLRRMRSATVNLIVARTGASTLSRQLKLKR